jgi:hypothetical protein
MSGSPRSRHPERAGGLRKMVFIEVPCVYKPAGKECEIQPTYQQNLKLIFEIQLDLSNTHASGTIELFGLINLFEFD